MRHTLRLDLHQAARMQVAEKAIGYETDADLVVRARNGDFSAYEILFERHRNLVFRFVYQLCRRQDDAEDLTQEVFVRALRNLDRYRDQAKFTTWLLRIASNLVTDRARSLNRRSALEMEQASDGLAWMTQARNDDPVENLEQERLQCAVEAALSQLKPQQREIIVMRDVQEMPYQEIASVLGCSVGGAKLRALRARKALRDQTLKLMGEEGK
ncbi:MAG: RNA polymerase sigma factor [Fimbriimonadaceae bacterium]